MTKLVPGALKDAPALIETVFPVQKLSVEAQRERKAAAGQTLTGLGSYWKGRKPLILVRAIILGSLLPQTDNAEKDLEIFEKLMAFDRHGLARRALNQNSLHPKDIAARIQLPRPWDYFTFKGIKETSSDHDLMKLECPFDADSEGVSIRWKRDITDDAKLTLIEKAINKYATYEEKTKLCRRPEEINQAWLYEPIWSAVNRHYKKWGINVSSFTELVEQFGILRFGHRPRIGDAFCGGGSIPFEAARLGCDVYASDLNPVACMLTWGAMNIVGADKKQHARLEEVQKQITREVDDEITQLGVEHDEEGNRAKAYLYCLETRCPETGWMVPILPTQIISPKRKVIAKLTPDHKNKRFHIEVVSGASKQELEDCRDGTTKAGALVYKLDGKEHRTPIKTLRGDYRGSNKSTLNRLRPWKKSDFAPQSDDIFQERLYAIQWITKDSIYKPRQITFFKSVTETDLEREARVASIVSENLESWQAKGLVPDMEIESGQKTEELKRTRGWTHWHHLFNARQLLLHSMYFKYSSPEDYIFNARSLDYSSRLCIWDNFCEKTAKVFYNQALNTLYNYGARGYCAHESGRSYGFTKGHPLTETDKNIQCSEAMALDQKCHVFITDPPYADAVNYHEITEYFIAWLRRNPPAPFDKWIWDSRRALAIRGRGHDFRQGMVDAYRRITDHTPDNGMQCVMFTHQDTGVWSDMVSIFWAAGLQVAAAWCIATETASGFKKGGYVQGTVILILRKRPPGERNGFKQRILPAVRGEVKHQIESMMRLNVEVKDKLGELVFNDSDLQMAGYAAALKVLTGYTHIGGEEVTSIALRPRRKGEVTIIDEMVEQSVEVVNYLLVPDGLKADVWSRMTGIERFCFRMMDMEATGAGKLDSYQNFAKAFHVRDYQAVMGSMKPNSARLKRITEFKSRDLGKSTELGPTWLGELIIGLQSLLKDAEPQEVVQQLQAEFEGRLFLEVRPLLADMLSFIALKSPEPEIRIQAEILGARLQNLRALNQ